MNRQDNNSQQLRINMLFYLTKCPYCQNFIRTLNNEGLIQHFKLICVDNLKEIPPGITKVPAVITADTNKIYLANDAFKWLQGIKYLRQQQQQIYDINERNKKIIQYNIYKNNQSLSQGPNSFLHSEMTGISDNYAYTNEDITKDIDMAQPKNFQQYNKNMTASDAIFTPPKEKEKITGTQQNQKLKEIEASREQQAKQFSELMKQEQLHAVMRAEREKIMYEKNGSMY